ncbi:hypothetical protein LSCM1_04370 [Leishmania martiniquensis]|uniref:Uncharacterized protein n=1 Tax=Leishmania martiniquensis TaxID=1580590 RepID=A0A836HBA5_9TRYP|nr:hypothetical protein LSCM1_04370 [Leishmania martiniquensis]
MFGASSTSATPVTLRHSYAAAVQHTPAIGASSHAVSRTALFGAAAVALGISAAVGGSLLQSRQRSETAAPVESASPPWWLSVARCLWTSSCSCDDDDAFASGRGAENLFDEEKVKARQTLSRGKAKGSARTQAATSATATAKNLATALKPGGSAPSVSEAKEVYTVLGSAEEVQEREHYIKLLRALLQREGGVTYDDSDQSSTSSDSTDVSLNYHLATAMEGNARDELLMACSTSGDGTIYDNAARDVGDGSATNLQLNIMIKALEYLDMSNEREKLRSRRIAMHREAGRATPVSSIDAAEEEEDAGEHVGGGDDAADFMQYRFAVHGAAAHHGMAGPMNEGDDGVGDEDDYPSAMQQKAQSFQSMLLSSSKVKMPSKDRLNINDSVLDRILGEGTMTRLNTAMLGTAHNGYAPLRADHADMMEDGWEAEDDDEEAELMAYLQQADNALHFYSREEMRRARRDPASDIRIVGMDNSAFGEGDAESEWEDEMDDENMAGTEEGDNTEADEEDDLAAATLWSRREKRCFERELFARIRHLAKSFALTDAMAEREVSEEDARKQAARKQRRQKGFPSSAKDATDPPPAAAAGDLAEGVEECEDEADWEDV